MSFKHAQKDVDEWTSQFKVQYWQPFENLGHITEEVGEIAREINHLFGPKKKKPSEQNHELGEEIADTIFALICLANSQKIDLDTSCKKMMDKCYKRDINRFEKK